MMGAELAYNRLVLSKFYSDTTWLVVEGRGTACIAPLVD